MFKQFTTKQLVFIALLGALLFIFDMVVVSGIEAATGVPGIGVLIDTLFVVAIATIGGLVIKKFWVFTAIALIYSILTVPTNIGGPPGIYKIMIGLCLGLIADLIVLLFQYRRIGYYFSLTIANILTFPLILLSLTWLGLPGSEELKRFLWLFIGLTAIESVIGTWLGALLYDKNISKLQIIHQIKG